ncbi:N-acylneuraminate cytidylyltransferase [compost metagenome]
MPGKNIRLLGKRPLISYTIEAALKSNFINRLIVNTDSIEIAQIAKDWGAEVPFMRPTNLAEDTTKTIDVLRDTVKWLGKNEKENYSEMILLQPTSPLRNNVHIDEAVKMYYEKKADSVISFCEEAHPIFWNKYLAPDNKIEDFINATSQNRQEYKKTYYPNGALYIFKTALLENGNFYSDRSYAYLMQRRDSVDIDTLDDFEYAEFLLRKR